MDVAAVLQPVEHCIDCISYVFTAPQPFVLACVGVNIKCKHQVITPTSTHFCDLQTQNATLERFKAGRLNTLVSTSVAEEGLDLKACQLVVSKGFHCMSSCTAALLRCIYGVILPRSCKLHCFLANSDDCDDSDACR